MANIDIAERQKIIGARIREGRDTYGGRQDAWHLMGNVIGRFSTLAEITPAAQLDFNVVKLQLEFQKQPVEAWATFRVDKAIPKGLESKPVHKITLPDGQEVYLNFLAPVGKDYEVIQHVDGGSLLDHLVSQIDGAHYETAGMLDFGRLVWYQVDPNLSIRVGDDVSNIFLTFHTSHDGSRSAEVFETGVREVCRNTYRLGSLKRLASTLRIRHTKNAAQRFSDLKAEIEEIRNVAMTMQDRLTWLSRRRVTKESLATVMNRLFPMTKNDDGVEESSTRRDNILAAVLERYEYNDGDAFPEQRGTAYNLFNGLTEWVDHERSSKGNQRAESAVFGSGNTLKVNALDLIIAEAEHMPNMLQRGGGVAVDFSEIGLNVPATIKN